AGLLERRVERGGGVALAEQKAVALAEDAAVEDGEDVDDREGASDVARAGGDRLLEHEPAGGVRPHLRRHAASLSLRRQTAHGASPRAQSERRSSTSRTVSAHCQKPGWG